MSPLLRLGGDACVGKTKSLLIYFSCVSIKTIMWCLWSTESPGFVLAQLHLSSPHCEFTGDLGFSNIKPSGLGASEADTDLEPSVTF